MTIISLGIPCVLSSVFDDNEEKYIVSYLFLDTLLIFHHMNKFFSQKESSLNKRNGSSFSKYALDVEYSIFVVFGFLRYCCSISSCAMKQSFP